MTSYHRCQNQIRADCSGAPPSEAASWGKIDPTKLEEAVTAYLDVTVALPLMVAYVQHTTKPKKQKRLYDRGAELPKAGCVLSGKTTKRWRAETTHEKAHGEKTKMEKKQLINLIERQRNAFVYPGSQKLRDNYRTFKKNLPRVQNAIMQVRPIPIRRSSRPCVLEGSSFDGRILQTNSFRFTNTSSILRKKDQAFVYLG